MYSLPNDYRFTVLTLIYDVTDDNIETSNVSVTVHEVHVTCGSSPESTAIFDSSV